MLAAVRAVGRRVTGLPVLSSTRLLHTTAPALAKGPFIPRPPPLFFAFVVNSCVPFATRALTLTWLVFFFATFPFCVPAAPPEPPTSCPGANVLEGGEDPKLKPTEEV